LYMKIDNKLIRNGLTNMYQFASQRFGTELVEARKMFDRLIPIPPENDVEMQKRLVMFSHWFLMDRILETGVTPADLFFKENLLRLSYQEEALYRALRISRIGIYNVTEKHSVRIAVDIATDERFVFEMDEDIRLPSNDELMTMRFINVAEKFFLLGSYATHHYSTKAFIQAQLKKINSFDRVAFSTKVFELTALSIKSQKYNWIEPLMIYKGMSRL